jgi:beta-phosphoglucomutase-like phosphatase (HAD superfamily)
MKILSDFDGVLTDQTEEAHRVEEIFKTYLKDLANTSALEMRLAQRLAEVEREMLNDSRKYGWKVSGRISAFSDEDLFIKCNALGAALDEEAHSSGSVFSELKSKLTVASDFSNLANVAYNAMVQETKSGKMKPLDPVAVKLIERILEQKIEFVVVSNSSTERIVDLFQKAGLPEKYLGQSPDLKSPFRVRGGASKYVLGSSMNRRMQVDGFWVETDRPKYEEILREEKPNMVIGDVFSLDLALPLYLSQSEPQVFGGMRLLLRTRDYTPGWILKNKNLEHLADFNLLAEKIGLH